MSVGRYIRIYLAVDGPEIISGYGLEEKSQKRKAFCFLGRTNYGGLRNVRLPVLDPPLGSEKITVPRTQHEEIKQNIYGSLFQL